MIQRLQSNISFKNTQISPANAQVIGKEVKKDFSIVDTYDKAKKGVTDILKGFNTVFGVTEGVAKGAVAGGLTAASIAIVGKNIKNHKGQIGGTLKGVGSDIASAFCAVPKILKALVVKSPLDNIKSLPSLITKGIKATFKGMWKHKLTALIAASAGFAVFAFDSIKGKIKANDKNASLDHKTNQGHV